MGGGAELTDIGAGEVATGDLLEADGAFGLLEGGVHGFVGDAGGFGLVRGVGSAECAVGAVKVCGFGRAGDDEGTALGLVRAGRSVCQGRGGQEAQEPQGQTGHGGGRNLVGPGREREKSWVLLPRD